MTAAAPMSPEELARRRPVWDAMSDVFLDTETRWAMPRVAFVLAEAGYTTEELEAIWHDEIVPECAWNLLQVAGEWALFVVDEEALAARAEGKGGSLLERMMGVASPIVLGGHWRAILALRDALLELPSEERAARTAMWTAFVHVYFEPSLEKMPLLDTHLESLRATGASEDALARAFEEVRPTLRSLLLAGELRDEERRGRDVRVAIGLATHAAAVP